MQIQLYLFVFSFFVILKAECPRKHEENVNNEDGHGPPGVVPEEHFIQTTFIHRDITDDDREYSLAIIDKIAYLRNRLKTHARVTIDNENVDCTDNGFDQCQDYPLDRAYHFLIVEDSLNGAAVYSIDKGYNFGKPGVIEMSLLDALSRHSLHPLVTYASDDAEREVGFVRELSLEEIEGFVQENNPEAKKKTSIFIRSPFELDLINQRILDLRIPDIDTSPRKLKEFTDAHLNEAIESGNLVFVMFWSHVNSVSVHAFHLWAKASELIEEDEETTLGFVPCHEKPEICTEYGITPKDHHTIFAYKNRQKNATQVNMRDAAYYTEWVQIIKNGPLKQLTNLDEFKLAKEGKLEHFADVRRSVTIGTFASESSKEFQIFQKVSNILNGRYHFLYRIDETLQSMVSTYRPQERQKRVDYNGKFDVKSLVDHVTHSSITSMLDFSNGFTSDIVYRSSKNILILIHSNHERLKQEVRDLSLKHEYSQSHLFAQIDLSDSLPSDEFFKSLKLENEDLPAICLFTKTEIRCFVRLIDSLTERLGDDPDHRVPIDPKVSHPLKWLQLEHVNKIFGHQAIELPPDPVTTAQHVPNPHNFDGMDLGAISGCPMVAHLNKHIRDEL